MVDLPVTAEVKAQLKTETGVELSEVRRLPDGQAALLSGRPLPQAPATGTSMLLSSFSVIEFRDWTSGQTGTLAATIRLSIAEIYARLSAGQSLTGNASVGQVLLVILVIIGLLFLVIQAAALVVGMTLARSITGSVHELFEGTERVRKGDFTHKIAITARDQLGELAESFNLDDGEHRGSAAAGGREEAPRRGAADRARDPDVAAASRARSTCPGSR